MRNKKRGKTFLWNIERYSLKVLLIITFRRKKKLKHTNSGMVLCGIKLRGTKCRGVSLKQHPMVTEKTINVYKFPVLGRFGVIRPDAKIKSWK
jgi:hypothetical protein